MSIKTIAVAIAAVAITSTSASACGFFTKAIYGGGCNQTEYEQIKAEDAKEKFESGKEEGFFMEGNLAFAEVNGEVVVMSKQDVIHAYKNGKGEAVAKLIGKEYIVDTLVADAVASGVDVDLATKIATEAANGASVEELEEKYADVIGDFSDGGKVLGVDKYGNEIDEKSIADFSLADFDTSSLSNDDILDVLTGDGALFNMNGNAYNITSYEELVAAETKEFGAPVTSEEQYNNLGN